MTSSMILALQNVGFAREESYALSLDVKTIVSQKSD